MTSFNTLVDAMRGNNLSSGLPQLDRVAPLRPGSFVVLVGASGVGKSRVAGHIVDTINCTNEYGALVASGATTADALDSSISFGKPALVLVDPISALCAPLGAAPDELMPRQRTPEQPDGPTADEVSEHHPVHPAELGRVAGQLRDLAVRHRVPVLACHRYTPIRDSVTGHIVSTESVNPLLDVADVVVVVRVQADPRMIGLEITRNKLGPTGLLHVPMATAA